MERDNFEGKDVCAIFIAPTIDNNTAETFRVGVWYRGNNEDIVNIIPLTLNQFRKMIQGLQRQRYTPRIFNNL